MHRKLQQFYIFNLTSERIKASNYKIKNLSIDEARKNMELVSVGESQMIRTIRRLNGSNFSQEELDSLWNKRAFLKKKRNSKDRANEIKILSKQIDDMLFVSDVVSITFNHSSHYKRMAKDGFLLNGNRYIRLFAGAGHLRRSTVLFIREELRDDVIEMFENGMDKNVPVNHGKYGAYLGLYSSSSLVVSTPRFVVVPDLEIKRIRKVDFVEDDNATVSEKNIEISHNVFDGQGLISISKAKEWSDELGLGYDACSFIVRSAFTKGLLVSFPFHLFAKENGIGTIVDIYGDTHNIFDVDVILTESQFKMGKHYKSIEEFASNCEKNGLFWGVTRFTPRIEKDSFWTSYQYIQVLDKQRTDIDALVEDTVNYFKDVSTMDARKSLVYFLGENTKSFESISFDKIENPIIKALAMNVRTIKDPHIRNTILKSLNKKIRDSYTGKLLMNGNYQFVVFDPYALAQHALIRNIKPEELGLLKEGYHYSQYWNNKNTSTVVSGRSPLTWRSELNILNFVDGSKYEKWFGHLYSGIVFNIHGVDMMLYGDADGDGDSVFTTDNRQMISGAMKNGKPVTYNKVSAPKEKLDYSSFVGTDIASFNSKIGLITNYSTTYYSMQSMFPPDSEEYKEIEKRLIICRRGQGNEIDKTKGIITAKFPEWDKKENNNPLHNRILAKKRPYWMQYLYSHKKKEWDEHFENYEYYCLCNWKMGIFDILDKSDLTREQEEVRERFLKYSPLLMRASGVMDIVSDTMLSRASEIRNMSKVDDFDYGIYMDKSIPTDRKIKSQILSLFKTYNKMKKDFYLNSPHEDISPIVEHIKNRMFEISSDLSELTNCAVELFYGDRKSGWDFVWQIFEDGIIFNMQKKYKTIKIPVIYQSSETDFVFLEKKYVIKEIPIHDNKEC